MSEKYWKTCCSYTDIKYVKSEEGIAKITINRPEVRNAFRPLTVREMRSALEDSREDTDIGVIILTGEGDKAFCSGGDQRVRGDSGYKDNETGHSRLNVLDFQREIRSCPKPVVAMVAGYAIGGGHVLHIICDITIAADNAIFGQTGPKVGSFDGGYGSCYLARIVGQKKAREIWFLCRQYGAQQALEMGLVNTVVPLENLEEETLQWSREMLKNSPSGDLFGWSHNVGMGWRPDLITSDQVLILTTAGGIREDDGRPVALGYHTGHWEVNLVAKEAAIDFKENNWIPFAGHCSDPCDGRTQGTTGMMDSLPYRNSAAEVLGRLIRSLPTARGLMGIATCDKGLPAMMMALAESKRFPGILVPGGVTLPPDRGEDAGTVQSIGSRFSHGEISLKEAAEAGCVACASSGGGCQFFGTAATSQAVAEALGISLPHSALAPSGEEVWLEMGRTSSRALRDMVRNELSLNRILTPGAFKNAMLVHAAMGGSTNLLLHLPAMPPTPPHRVPTRVFLAEIFENEDRRARVLRPEFDGFGVLSAN